MERGGPSRTAWSAAAHRAAHQLLDGGRVFPDPLAVPILGGDPDGVVAWTRARPERALVRSFIAARHRFGEDALARPVAGGMRQVVVLGAGLDTFGYRNPGARVFEVDHPDTQAWKRDRLDEAGISVPDGLRFAPVDFETQSLADGLVAAGFDAAAPAFFLWLGVVPYLTRDAVWTTLRYVAGIPEAAVVFDYANPVEQLADEARRRHRERAERVRGIGEPWRTYLDTEELAAGLAALGLPVVEDLGPVDVATRYFGAPAGLPPRPGGHLVLAGGAPPAVPGE